MRKRACRLAVLLLAALLVLGLALHYRREAAEAERARLARDQAEANAKQINRDLDFRLEFKPLTQEALDWIRAAQATDAYPDLLKDPRWRIPEIDSVARDPQ
jgi:hypothetical protein